MTLELTVVDAFTDRPFSGNPAAICFVDEFPNDARMQTVAAEMNLAETAFVVERGEGRYDLRWFSPTVEVDLCGHATLATTHILGRPATFRTRSGELVCSVTPDGVIEMDFPADPPSEAELPDGTGLGGVRRFVGASSTAWPSWTAPRPSGQWCPTSRASNASADGH